MIAQRCGKSEEDVLKEEVTKEKLHVRCSFLLLLVMVILVLMVVAGRRRRRGRGRGMGTFVVVACSYELDSKVMWCCPCCSCD